jgi:hypothetical protein
MCEYMTIRASNLLLRVDMYVSNGIRCGAVDLSAQHFAALQGLGKQQERRGRLASQSELHVEHICES